MAKKENLDFEVLKMTLETDTREYKKKFDEISKNKKIELEEVEKNYKNGDLKNTTIEAINRKYFAKEVVLTEKYLRGCNENVERVRQMEALKIETIDDAKINKLKAIEDIPVTREEIMAIIERYEVDKSYWASRMVKIIAEKNGIYLGGDLEADFAVKTNILDKLLLEAEEVARFYKGFEETEDDYRDNVLYLNHSPQVLNEYAKQWYGENNYIAGTDLVNNIMLAIYCKRTPIEKSIQITNAIRNIDKDHVNKLLTAIALDTSIPQAARDMSSYRELLSEFKNGKANQYSNAEQCIEQIANFDAVQAKEYIEKHVGKNEFLKELIEENIHKGKVYAELAKEYSGSEVSEQEGNFNYSQE